MVVFIKIFNQRWSVLSLHEQQECSGFDIKRQISENQGVPEDEFFLTCNGIILENHSKLNDNETDSFVHCHVRVPGGKGGFGSMLRAIGAQIEKTTNREACRDLSGRRMRDVNDEKKIADWLSKQAERDQEKARRKQERLERLQTAPKHVFEDSTTYTTQLQENMDSIDDALQKGLISSTSSQSSSSLSKRKAEDKCIKKRHEKKRRLWVDIDEELSSESEEESDTRSSCSSVTDSDFSLSETSSKVSSTASNSVLPSGNISEEENNASNSSTSNESRGDAESETLDNGKSPLNSDEIYEQQKNSTHPDTNILEQFVRPEKEKQETLASKETSVSDNKASELTVGTIEREESKLQATQERVDTAECGNNTGNAETEVCSDNSVVSTADIEGNSGKTEEQNEDMSKTKCSVSIPLDVDQYQSLAELEALGLDVLKSALMSLGLKCGGTLQQRAERLFSIKGVPRDKIDTSLFAKPSGKSKEKKR